MIKPALRLRVARGPGVGTSVTNMSIIIGDQTEENLHNFAHCTTFLASLHNSHKPFYEQLLRLSMSKRLCMFSVLLPSAEIQKSHICSAFMLRCLTNTWTALICPCNIRESVDSLCRDGADTPIVRVHWKAFLTREYSRFKPFSAREWPIQPLLYPMIPHK